MSNQATRRIVIVASLVLLVAPGALRADEPVSRINREVTRLLQMEDDDLALKLAEEGMRLAEASLGEDSPDLAQALRNLAAASRATDDTERAQQLYENLVRIREKVSGPDDPDLADDVASLASVYRLRRELDKSLAAYRRVLALREADPRPHDAGLVDVLTDLSGLYQMQGNFAEARSAMQRAIEIQEKRLGPDHPRLVTPLRFLAAICYAMRDTKAGDAATARASRIEPAPRNLPLADADKGALAITVWVNPSISGAVGGGKGRMRAAEVYFVRREDHGGSFDGAKHALSNYSSKERETLVASTSAVITSSYNQDGDVFLVNVEPGRYLAVGALLISEIPGSMVAYPGYFSTEIVARSEVEVQAGRMAYMGDVRATVRGAPDPVQKLFFDRIPMPQDVVIDVAGLGPVSHRPEPQWIKFERFERGGKRETAFWKRSRKTLRNDPTWVAGIPEAVAEPAVDPETDNQRGQAGQRIADRLASGDYADALEAAGKTLAACERSEDANATCLGPALVNLGDIQTAMGDDAAAGATYGRALELRKQVLGPQHPAVALTLEALAWLSHRQDDDERAERLLGEATGLLESALGAEHPFVADVLETLASIQRAGGRYDEAHTLTERVLRIREDALGWTHPTVVPPLLRLAEDASRAGRPEASVPLLERALSVQERALGPEKPQTLETLLALARADHDTGNAQAAAEACERALPLQRKAFGRKDRRVIETMRLLASCLDTLDDPDTARSMRDRADVLSQEVALDELSAIGEALVRYAYANGGYPHLSDIFALEDLLQPAFLLEMPTKDAWGNPYVVELGEDSYTLRSLGKNGVADATVGGETTGFEADIVYSDGALVQWPALRP